VGSTNSYHNIAQSQIDTMRSDRLHYRRAIIFSVKALIFFNALINALLMHPGPSGERVQRGKVTLGPTTFGGPRL